MSGRGSSNHKAQLRCPSNSPAFAVWIERKKILFTWAAFAIIFRVSHCFQREMSPALISTSFLALANSYNSFANNLRAFRGFTTFASSREREKRNEKSYHRLNEDKSWGEKRNEAGSREWEKRLLIKISFWENKQNRRQRNSDNQR